MGDCVQGIFGDSSKFLGNANWKICDKSELCIIDPLQESMAFSCGTKTEGFDMKGELNDIFKDSGGANNVLANASLNSSGGVTIQITPQQLAQQQNNGVVYYPPGSQNANSQGGYFIPNQGAQPAFSGAQTITITVPTNTGQAQYNNNTQANSGSPAHQNTAAQNQNTQILQEYADLVTEYAAALKQQMEESQTVKVDKTLTAEGQAREILNSTEFLTFLEADMDSGGFLGGRRRMRGSSLEQSVKKYIAATGKSISAETMEAFSDEAKTFVSENSGNHNSFWGNSRINIKDIRIAKERAELMENNPAVAGILKDPTFLKGVANLEGWTGLSGKELAGFIQISKHADKVKNVDPETLEAVCSAFVAQNSNRSNDWSDLILPSFHSADSVGSSTTPFYGTSYQTSLRSSDIDKILAQKK